MSTWRATGGKNSSADTPDGSPISTTLVEMKLPGEGGVGGRRERTLTIFFALRLAWRNPRKDMLCAPVGVWKENKIAQKRGESNQRYKGTCIGYTVR